MGPQRACWPVAVLLALLGCEGLPITADTVERHQRSCDAGDTDSCFQLALSLLNGPERLQDHHRARSVLEPPCAEKRDRNCGLLGILERDGVGGPAEPSRAVQRFEQACDAGHAISCTNLGAAYLTGHGVAADRARALALFQRGCDAGNAKACENIEFVESQAPATPAGSAN